MGVDLLSEGRTDFLVVCDKPGLDQTLIIVLSKKAFDHARFWMVPASLRK